MGGSASINAVDALNCSQVDYLASTFRFAVDITALQNSFVLSPAIELNTVQWRVQLQFTYLFESITAHLVPYSDNAALKWSCDAEATYKLVDANGILSPGNTSKKLTYSYTNSTQEITNVIGYNELMENYVSENKVTFEIYISTSRFKVKKSNGFQQIYAKVHILLKNVSALGEDVSEDMTVRGLKWRVRTAKNSTVVDVHLQAMRDNFDKELTYEVTGTVSLLSFDANTKPIVKNFNQIYRWASNVLGIDSFVRWSDLTDEESKFVLDNEAHLVVEFKVEEPKQLWDIDNQLSKPKKNPAT